MATGAKPKMVLEPNGTEVATPAGGARRYRKPFQKLRWQDIRCLLSDSFDQWSKHNAPRLGASLAFYSLLSLAPLLLVVVSIVGLVFGHSAAERDTIRQVQSLVGPAAGKAVAAFLQGSKNTTHGVIATVVGLVTLLMSASGVLIELRDALNTIWEVDTPAASGFGMVTSFIKQRLFSFAIVLSIGFLLIVSLVVSTWISALGALSASVVPWQAALMHVVNSLISFLVITGLFAAIYKIMPDVRVEWRDVILGGAVTSLLFTLGKLILGIYLGRASYASTYGAAASIVVLIAWVYYSAQIFFLGAEFTKAFATRYGSHPNLHPAGMVQPAANLPPGPETHLVTPSGTS
ncbi:MAG TPA: YihY/virulence factor BrkB family protein [Bryobacteraceae bacterium]|jgi:membrane protein|nr:YihY/virulence factor BrkB family protein [Bryobacteraceae bacterium]